MVSLSSLLLPATVAIKWIKKNKKDIKLMFKEKKEIVL